jgi:hypothetical protein
VGSLVVATGPGRLLEFSGQNATGGGLYVLAFDAAAVPASGTAAAWFPVDVAAHAPFRRTFKRPWHYSAGLVLVGSSTSTTYTPAASSFWLSAQAEA